MATQQKLERQFSSREMVSIRMPISNYIVCDLLQKGFPIRISRENKFDVQELRDEEIEVIDGILHRYTDARTGNLVFVWEKGGKNKA